MTDSLVERVAKIIPRYSMFRPGDRVGVAVSGGADSVALLHILSRLAARFSIELAVLHVNHRLRGGESDSDEAFVRSVAGGLQLPFFGEQRRPDDGNVEQVARSIRRQFFERTAAAHSLRRIALGHSRSDQAETVLFRLLRGSGLTGLAAMRPASEDLYVRPLLGCSRDEIRAWAKSEGIIWREDSSNADPGFRRNRLRLETLPALTRDFNPHLEAALASTAELASAEEDFWREQVEPLYAASVEHTRLGLLVDASFLNGLHPAVQRRLVRRLMAELRPGLRGLDFTHYETIRGLCESTEGHQRALIPGIDAVRSFDTLLLTYHGRLNENPRRYCLELQPASDQELPFGAGHIYVSEVDSTAALYDNFKEDQGKIQTADLDTGIWAGGIPLIVRNWEPGDQLHRSGHRSAEKVKSLFQEQRVLLWNRRHWPVVAKGSEIVWVRDFGVSQEYSPAAGEGARVRLVYRAQA